MINIKEILLCVAFIVTTAMAVNHYARLDVELLNDLEMLMVPGKILDDNYYSSSQFQAGTSSPARTPQCVVMLKILGESRHRIRKQISEAERNGEAMKAVELEQKLYKSNERVANACQ